MSSGAPVRRMLTELSPLPGGGGGGPGAGDPLSQRLLVAGQHHGVLVRKGNQGHPICGGALRAVSSRPRPASALVPAAATVGCHGDVGGPVGGSRGRRYPLPAAGQHTADGGYYGDQ